MANRAKVRHEAEVLPECFVMVVEWRSDRLVKLVLVLVG
jgi:hypothetical protein